MKAILPLGRWIAPRPHGQTPATARMMVLLPLPDWPRISTRSGRLDLDLGLGHQHLAVGPRHAELAHDQAIVTRSPHAP